MDKLVCWAGLEEGGKPLDIARKEIERVRDDLAGPSPTATELMLAETAALCWFTLRALEHRHAGASRGDALTGPEEAMHQKRITAAHRRLMGTLKTLETVRRLASPSLQVNIAGQQVVMNRPPGGLEGPD